MKGRKEKREKNKKYKLCLHETVMYRAWLSKISLLFVLMPIIDAKEEKILLCCSSEDEESPGKRTNLYSTR